MPRLYLVIAVIFALLTPGGMRIALADPTPPIMPHIEETPLPPSVELPALEQLPADMPNRPLTAGEAALIALRHQPSVNAAEAGVAAAKGRVQQAKAGLNPTLAFGAGYSNQAISPSGGVNATGFTVSSTLRKLLFDYNHTRDLVAQASAQQQASTANLSRVQSDLVFQVKQAFYQYVQNQRLVGVNEANLQNRRQHLALAQARLQGGVGLPVDVVRAETAVSDAVLSLNLARNAASISRVSLAQLMGIDPRTPIEVAEDNEASLGTDDFNVLVETALKQRPEILQGEANIRASQANLRAVKTTNAPALAGTAGLSIRGDDFPPSDKTLTLGLGVQWSPFDGGVTAGKISEAEANLQSAQAQLETAKYAVLTDVSQAYLNAKTAEQRVATADAAVANATEGLRLAQGRYSAGLGVFLDVLDAQNALVTAQTNRINAQSAVNTARAALARALNGDAVLEKAQEHR